MPATVSFIQLTPQTSIPIRVFINRKRILLSNRVAINEKSIIKLSTINLLRLSNNDLTKLIFEINLELKQILFHTPLNELFPKRFVYKSTKLSRDIGDNWKCKLVVSLGYIVNLRYKLGWLREKADIQFILERNIVVSTADSNKIALLTKEIKFNFGGQVQEEENEIAIDDKKSLSYKLNRLTLLNNSIVDSLDLYVLHRPKA